MQKGTIKAKMYFSARVRSDVLDSSKMAARPIPAALAAVAPPLLREYD